MITAAQSYMIELLTYLYPHCSFKLQFVIAVLKV